MLIIYMQLLKRKIFSDFKGYFRCEYAVFIMCLNKSSEIICCIAIQQKLI